MRFVTVRRSTEQTTIVNIEQIAYLSHAIYGTKIFFASGDHIICPDDSTICPARGIPGNCSSHRHERRASREARSGQATVREWAAASRLGWRR